MDLNITALKEFEDVQKYFLRRLSGVRPHSELSFLYTETGLLPIRARRIMLALRYLRYLIQLPHTRLAHAALRECSLLHNAGKDCWLSDLENIIGVRPFQEGPLPHLDELSSESELDVTDAIIQRIQDAAWRDILGDLHRSRKLNILQSRHPLPQRLEDSSAFKLQPYLMVPTNDHRKALTRLMTSSHHLAVESLRWSSTSRQNTVPRDSRVCRFCRQAVEDEIHALFECLGNAEILVQRNRFYRTVVDIRPNMEYLLKEGRYTELLNQLLDDFKVNSALAAYTHFVLRIFDEVPVYRGIMSIDDQEDDEAPESSQYTIPDEEDRDEIFYS